MQDLLQDVLQNQEVDVLLMELVLLLMFKQPVLKTQVILIVFGIQLVKRRHAPMPQQPITLTIYVHLIYLLVLLNQEVDVKIDHVLMLQQH